MSWTDEELDDLFKDASEKQSFGYDSAFFKDIEAQLPVRKKKRIGFWWFGGAGTLMILIMGIVIFNGQNNELQLNDQTESDSNKSSNALLNENNDIASSQINYSDKNGNNTDTQAQNSMDQADLNARVANINQPGIPTVLNGPEDDILKAPSHTIDPSENKLDAFSGLNNNSGISGNQNETNEMLLAGEVSGLAINHDLSLGTSEATDLESFKYSIKPRVPKSMLYAELGAGLGQSPVSSSDNGSSRSFIYGIHLGYEHSWSNWSASVGAGLSEQSFSNLYINERSYIYGFGLNTVDNQYRFSSIVRLDIHVNVTRRFGSHQIVAGINTAMPLIARLSYKEIINDELIEEGRGYTDASYFRKLIIEPTIGYRFSLNNNWSIGAQMKIQVMNPLNTDRVKGERTPIPLSGQVTLKRTLGL